MDLDASRRMVAAGENVIHHQSKRAKLAAPSSMSSGICSSMQATAAAAESRPATRSVSAAPPVWQHLTRRDKRTTKQCQALLPTPPLPLPPPPPLSPPPPLRPLPLPTLVNLHYIQQVVDDPSFAELVLYRLQVAQCQKH